MAEPITVEELDRLLRDKVPVTVVDVRLDATGAIPGAEHVPVTDLEEREWPWDRERLLVVYCQHGRGASAYAAEVLEQQGFRAVRTLVGGLDAWRQAHGAG
ncbi:MAG: rhodanese-like domain-containing protein [Firmicutes bacterium]|nr:rhodanese-like domain-containing protein [Alicyclobacillaceae bacterium]MCL6497688.1 rhodanese-like domain-containing protein [Bacillota bacterium]